jgi:hypothetical protein
MFAESMLKMGLKRGGIIAGLLFVLAAGSNAADMIVWKPIPQVVLHVDDQAPKLWNIYRSGKKADPLLVQLGARMLIIYIRDQKVYEIKPEQLEHKGQDLLWRDTDRPERPLPTSDWTTRDIGSAWRVRVKLAAESHTIDIEIPQLPDLRGLY